MNDTLEKAVCQQCGIDVHPETLSFNGGLCDEHRTWKRAKEDKVTEAKTELDFRMQKFKQVCPTQYQENDISLIPEEIFKAVFSYKFGSQGLLCMGASKTGKTTSCWRMIENVYVLHGINFECLTEVEFSLTAAKQIRNRGIDQWLDKLCNAPLLFLDDIGHAATSSRHLEELFYVTEKRTSWKRPIIATTQFTELELQERARASGGAKTIIAILNRLKTSCEIVLF